MNILHSSRTDKWYTPVWVLDLCRQALGYVALDPASDLFGNTRVKAARILTEADDGLTSPWGWSGSPITVFCNPPGGKKGNKSMAGLFWARLMKERELGRIRHAIFLAFSAEALQNTQGKGLPAIGEFPCCVPAKRLRFDTPDGEPGAAPSHSNIIVYVPGTEDHTERFIDVFDDVGTILNRTCMRQHLKRG